MCAYGRWYVWVMSHDPKTRVRGYIYRCFRMYSTRGVWWYRWRVKMRWLKIRQCGVARRNTLLVYYPKYPLMCEICAVAICDSGYSEECTLTLYMYADACRCTSTTPYRLTLHAWAWRFMHTRVCACMCMQMDDCFNHSLCNSSLYGLYVMVFHRVPSEGGVLV